MTLISMSMSEAEVVLIKIKTDAIVSNNSLSIDWIHLSIVELYVCRKI